MTTQEIADTLVKLCSQAKFHEAMEALYSPDIVSMEAGAPPGGSRESKGIAAVRAKGEWWTTNHEVHSSKVEGPLVAGSHFAVTFKLDVTFKPQNRRFTMEEVALYKVANGKIVYEEFFYNMQAEMKPLRGSFWVFVLYDVAEEIQLDRLCDLVGAQLVPPQPSFKHPTPEYVRFERPPAIEYPQPLAIGTGEQFEVRIKYFDYGVVSIELQLEFEANWDELVRLSNRWILAPELEGRTSELLRPRLERAEPALKQPYSPRVNEDYYIIHLREALDETGRAMTAPAMLATRGGEIAQIVRGESVPLSDGERNEVLQSSLSYYPSDLLVVGWVAALVQDTPSGAAPTIQLLEYANTQLLEFRHYDDVLTRVLEGVYKMLERHGSFLRRWKMAREAERLNTLRLDITELTERTDNAIKFLSDMFYARAYRMAAVRVGVTDYRNLVEQKLRTAGDLYEFMTNEFHQARAFVLEALVVAILVIELIHLFRGGW